MSRHAGIPLLSGPPPPGPMQSGCKKCGREFTLVFHRQRKCMHCGYGYCSSCTDYQALMPRRGPAHGYDVVPVCAFCIEMLNVTALGRAQLRSIPLAKLRRYINAYNISVKNPVDKNDLVDAALAARTPQGCLSAVNEDYYRKHSVPPPSTPGPSPANRNSTPRGFPNNNANSSPRSNRSFPRPDLDPNRRQRPPESAYNAYTPRSRTTSAPVNPGTVPTGGQPNIPRPTPSARRQFTPRTASNAQAPSNSQAAPPPPMSTLVTLPRSSLSALSVGTLKQVLWEARVRVPPGVVEKEELVERVWALVEEEKRKDNEGIDDIEVGEDEMEDIEDPDREEEAVLEMVSPEPDVPPEYGRGNTHHDVTADGAEDGPRTGDSEMTHGRHHSAPTMDSQLPHSRSNTPEAPARSPKPSTSPAPHVKSRSLSKPTSTERSGLCVICQDEEANIAIVDCGHLAMCRGCSDLVLASSKECPLCRTRIVTEARLLRIFKT